MTRMTKGYWAILLALTLVILDPAADSHAQIGVPGIPGPGIGGGITSFTPSVSNMLNRNPSQGVPAAMTFGRARQESSTPTPKYMDTSAFGSNQTTRSSGVASFSDSLVSQKIRRSERIGQSRTSANVGFKIPPGIRAVKSSRRSAAGSMAIEAETNKPASLTSSGSGLSPQPEN